MKISVKTAFYLMIGLFISSFVTGQTITIGSGNSEQYVPMNPYYGYTYSQSIYDQSEIGVIADVDKIRFYFNGNSAITSNPVEIYLGHTAKSTFSSSSDWVDVSLLTLVYSGALSTTSTAGWVEIDITNFTYNNADNLLVAFLDEDGNYQSSSDDFYATSCTGNKCIYDYQDSPQIDPATPPDGTLQAYRPNIQFEMVGATPMSYVGSTCTQNNTEDLYPGTADVEIIGVEVETDGNASPLEITSFDINMNGTDDPLNDVDDVEIYYTGLVSTFSTGTLYGNAAPDAGNININGSQILSNGINYFWIVYDVAAGATTGNFIDAECTQINFSGGTGSLSPSTSVPSGNREIIPVPPVYLMDNSDVNSCYGVFYDSGGETSDYNSGEDYIKTFCSNDGTNLRFEFTSFQVQNTFDQLRIYDGAEDTCLVIGTYTTEVPDVIISSGSCLTFKFTSDGFTEASGWAADFECFDAGVCGANPDASDLCVDAPLLDDMNGICGTTGNFNATDLSGTNLQSEFCGGVSFINNNSWLKFQASEPSIELSVICNCSGSGLEAAVFETADCIIFNQIACYDPFYNSAPGMLKVNNLTIGNYYYLMLDQFSDPGCDFQINGLSGVVLPVELTDFEVRFNGEQVELNWETATELNNDYFTVERSSNGLNFHPLARIPGAGSTHELNRYSFLDDNLQEEGYYYRLKQTDFDGAYSHSDIVYVNCISNRQPELKLYPNPVKDVLYLNFEQTQKSGMHYDIKNCLGVCSQNGYLEAGKSGYKIKVAESLKGGMYVLTVSNEKYTESYRLMLVE
jgi:hypothetical protein